MSAELALSLALARLRARAAVALEPEEAQQQMLAARLPEARALERVDRAATVLTIDVLGSDD
jgi:hypothetical protein